MSIAPWPTRPILPMLRIPNRPKSGIYIIKCGEFYKIGYGVNLEKRIRQILQLLPPSAKLVSKIEIRKGLAPKLERKLHIKFSSQRIKGEWFTLTDSDLLSIEDLNRKLSTTTNNKDTYSTSPTLIYSGNGANT